jgi:hypothetical protein
LEDLFLSRNYDSTTLSNLINSYGILVEYYDLTKDPIKRYFLEKIQQVLAQPHSIALYLP